MTGRYDGNSSLIAHLTLDTPNSDVTHAGVNHLRLARRWAVTQAIVGSAQVRAAFDHLARNAKLRLRWIVALLRRADAWIVRRTATGFDDLVGVTWNVPVIAHW